MMHAKCLHHESDALIQDELIQPFGVINESVRVRVGANPGPENFTEPPAVARLFEPIDQCTLDICASNGNTLGGWGAMSEDPVFLQSMRLERKVLVAL